MILVRCWLILLGIIAIQTIVKAHLLDTDDQQNCATLCSNCEGEATFEDSVCQCHVIDDNQQGAECIGRIRRQAGELGLDVVSCDLADPEADRTARCILNPARRFRNRNDLDLVAKYFTGAGNFGSLLGSSKSETGKKTSEKENSCSSSTTENVGSKKQSSEIKTESDAPIVGDPNPFTGISPIASQLIDISPLVSAAATWLHPHTLLAMGNGISGPRTQSFIGQPKQSLMSGPINHDYGINSMPLNFVGSPSQDIVSDSTSIGMQNLYRTQYPAGALLGVAPYPYLFEAPNSVQLQDRSSIPLVQPYTYGFNSMVGGQNPLFVAADPLGASPLWNSQSSLDGPNCQPLSDPTDAQKSNLDEADKPAEEVLGEPHLDSSIDPKQDSDSEDETDKELEASKTEIVEPVVSSKQTPKTLKENAVDPEETTDQKPDSLNKSTKLKQRRFRSKGSGALSEKLVKKRIFPEAVSSSD